MEMLSEPKLWLIVSGQSIKIPDIFTIIKIMSTLSTNLKEGLKKCWILNLKAQNCNVKFIFQHQVVPFFD